MLILGAIILFIIVPGFYISAITDLLTPLTVGPIWAISIVGSIAVFYISLKVKKNQEKAFNSYLKVAGLLSLIFLITALLFEGKVFSYFTAKKMLFFIDDKEPKGAKNAFYKVEQERGRLIFPLITVEILMQIKNSGEKKASIIKKLYFDELNNGFERKLIGDYFIKSDDSSVTYYASKNQVARIEKELLMNKYVPADNTISNGDREIQYKKGESVFWVEYASNKMPSVRH